MPDNLLSHTNELRPEAAAAAGGVPHPPRASQPLARRLARAGLAAADAICAALTPGWVRDTPGLVVLALHSLCRSRAELHDPALAPNQNVCVEDFRALVEAMLECGYVAVTPEQVAAGLAPGGKYVLFTFDDGYFNNTLALDVLESCRVPAAFFISSNHVLEGRGFWWDVVHRELAAAGLSTSARNAQVRRFKALLPGQIERVLRARHGPAALRPRGDGDRPFAPAELADFARNRWVHLGNHTADHGILTRCTPDEARRQIEQCQAALRSITGTAPVAIAYPNGNHSPAVAAAARAAGLRIGLTVQPARNPLAAADDQRLMRLGRFYFHGRPDVDREFRGYRGGFVPSRLVHRMLQAA